MLMKHLPDKGRTQLLQLEKSRKFPKVGRQQKSWRSDRENTVTKQEQPIAPF
jgi:hypothetical protein